MIERKILKSSVLGATALATSPVWGKGGPDASSGIGADFLTLDEIPGQNVAICIPSNQGSGSKSGNGSHKADDGILPDALSIVVDPFETSTIRMLFSISEMTATDEDRVLFLVYSTQNSLIPQMVTHPKGPPLGINLSNAQILGFYNIPALRLEPQEPSELGLANPTPTFKMTVNINFDTDKLVDKIRTGDNTIYVQAGMVKARDFRYGIFDDMILSEMDTLQFLKECPNGQSYKADDSGEVTKGSGSSTNPPPDDGNQSGK